MKGINLAIAYDEHFWVPKNIIPSSGLKVKVYSKRNISQITKVILKRNDFIVIKTINDMIYGRAFFNVLSKFALRASKTILVVVTLSGPKMLKFVFPFNFFVYIAPKGKA